MFFESLRSDGASRAVAERDRAMIDPLKSVGIEKGKPFIPTKRPPISLGSAAQEAREWFVARYESGYEPHASGSRWFLPADKALLEAVADGFTNTDVYPTDGRGTAYYYAFSSIKHMGAGQFYLFVSRDKDGNPLEAPPHTACTCRRSRRSSSTGRRFCTTSPRMR